MNKYIIAALGLSCLVLSAAYFIFSKSPQTFEGCSNIEIALDALDEISCTVTINKTDRYAVNINYEIDYAVPGDVWRVRKIVQGLNREETPKADKRAPVKIYANVNLIKNGESTEIISQSWDPEVKAHGAEALVAEIFRTELNPGKYEVRVKNIKAIPEMKTVKTYIDFKPAYEGK